MKPQCDKCKVDLEFVKGNEPWDIDHLQCSKCDGTYNISEFCELCAMHTHTRGHHLIPRCLKGKKIANICETCESYIHKNWSHHELRDTFNSVEAILANEGFQKFLKWRLKQPPTVLFKSSPNKFRNRNPYH